LIVEVRWISKVEAFGETLVDCDYCDAEMESTWEQMHSDFTYSGFELKKKKENLALSVILHLLKSNLTNS
jgi:hypothetical protein